MYLLQKPNRILGPFTNNEATRAWRGSTTKKPMPSTWSRLVLTTLTPEALLDSFKCGHRGCFTACWSCNWKIFYIKCKAGSRLAWQNHDDTANLSFPLYSMLFVARNSYNCSNICQHIIWRDGVFPSQARGAGIQDIVTYIFLSCIIIIIIAAAGRVIRPAGSSRPPLPTQTAQPAGPAEALINA